MNVFHACGRCRPWLLGFVIAIGVTSIVASARADTPATAPSELPATQPATQPTASVDPTPDPTGFNGGKTNPLLQPNSYLTGWVSGSADKNLDANSGGAWKPWAGDKPTVEELGQHVSK